MTRTMRGKKILKISLSCAELLGGDSVMLLLSTLLSASASQLARTLCKRASTGSRVALPWRFDRSAASLVEPIDVINDGADL